MCCNGRSLLRICALVGGLMCAGAPLARAQDGADSEEQNAQRMENELAPSVAAQPEARWGVGLRLRYVTIPRFLLEQFWQEVKSSSTHAGFGLDAVRRRGDFELSFGFEYDNLSGEDGFWLEKGDDAVTPGQTPDFVEFNNFAWLTLDASFVFHKQLTDIFALRYGGGFGLGLVLGDVRQTDAVCSGRDINEPGVCMIDPNAQQVNDPADIPPVFPVVNLLVGGQLRPVDQILINFEVGIRTAFYAGTGVQYLF